MLLVSWCLKNANPIAGHFIIDASKECAKITNNNKLDEKKNIPNILNAYKNKKTVQYFTYLATKDEIEKADYNLSVSTYVESEDTREIIDINVLNAKINKIVQRENTLRQEINAIIAEIEGV